MQQPNTKLTPKRTLEVADSLESDARKKINLGTSQKKYIGKPTDSLKKTEWGKTLKNANALYESDKGGKLLDPKTYGTTADEKIEFGKKQLANAARYKKLALKAMSKNK